MPSFAVLGATSWGVTLAWLLANNGHDVALLTRTPSEADAVRRAGGLARLNAISLPPNVVARAAADYTTSGAGVVVAAPAQSVRATARDFDFRGAPILSAAKGLEHGTDLRMTEVLREVAPASSVAALSGPNLSHEIAAGMPAAGVIASADGATAALWQDALGGRAYRAYTSSDVVGVELGGALKNVIAIAAGAASGYRFGANAVATIMTRGLAEMTRLGVALGADAMTFQGLAGVGDLAATCFSPLSRNRRMGELLAAGHAPEDALNEIGEAVEGVATARANVELATKVGVAAPIAEQVDAVLRGAATVSEAMDALLRRPLGPESRPLGR